MMFRKSLAWVLAVGGLLALVGALLAGLSGCRERSVDRPSSPVGGLPATPGSPAVPTGRSRSAGAELRGGPGSSVRGLVSFVEEGSRIRVTARVSGLSPGEHGFHIHENGVCQAPDFKSAGDHFDPHHGQHGPPQASRSHAGDLGNIKAGPDGTATYTTVLSTEQVTLEPGPRTIRDRAVVVHQQPDDLKTQPAGASGPRVACGVVRPAL